MTALALALMAGSAAAQDGAVERARVYFHAGAQAYALGDFLTAIQAFEQANAVAPRPGVTFSLAQAERRQYFVDHDPGHLQRAIELFRQYIRDVPSGGRRADAVEALSELEPLLSRVRAEASQHAQPPPRRESLRTRLMVSSPTPEARVMLDGRSLSDAPYIGEVRPGKHLVQVSAPGHFEEQREVLAVEGGLVALDITLRERPARLVFRAPAGTQLLIDGRLQGEAPMVRSIEVPAGRHLIAVSRPGFIGTSREVDLQRGQEATVDAFLPPSAQRTAATILLGASASTLVASAVFGYFAHGRDVAANEVLDDKASGNITADQLELYNEARRDRDRLRNGAIVALGASATFAITGAILYSFDQAHMRPWRPPTKTRKPGDDAPRTLATVPIIGPGLVGAGVSQTF